MSELDPVGQVIEGLFKQAWQHFRDGELDKAVSIASRMIVEPRLGTLHEAGFHFLLAYGPEECGPDMVLEHARLAVKLYEEVVDDLPVEDKHLVEPSLEKARELVKSIEKDEEQDQGQGGEENLQGEEGQGDEALEDDGQDSSIYIDLDDVYARLQQEEDAEAKAAQAMAPEVKAAEEKTGGVEAGVVVAKDDKSGQGEPAAPSEPTEYIPRNFNGAISLFDTDGSGDEDDDDDEKALHFFLNNAKARKEGVKKAVEGDDQPLPGEDEQLKPVHDKSRLLPTPGPSSDAPLPPTSSPGKAPRFLSSDTGDEKMDEDEQSEPKDTDLMEE